jgi:succinoglycan biosynthesis protein ExoO
MPVKYSVIMPVYNKAPHISNSIKSVLAQKYTNFELIIVNDGSTDNSKSEILKFNDARIKLFSRKTPGGAGYAARNKGISYASGEWVAFIDADDYWASNHLLEFEVLCNKFTNATLLGSGWYELKDNIKSRNPFRNYMDEYCLIDIHKYLSYQKKGLDVLCTDVVAVRHDVIVGIGGFPDYGEHCQRAGDGATWLKLLVNDNLLAWSPIITAQYNKNSINMVSNRCYSISQNCLLNYIKFLLEDESHSTYKKDLLHYYQFKLISSIFQKIESKTLVKDDIKLILGLKKVNVKILLILTCFFVPFFNPLVVLMRKNLK